MIEIYSISRNHQKEWTRSQQEKASIQEREVSFFGHRWNSTGISPDPKKTESILKMQFPTR